VTLPGFFGRSGNVSKFFPAFVAIVLKDMQPD
jgi:hypothetical protein